MNYRLLFLFVVLFPTATITGCNNYVQVNGKVTFADDRSVLGVGTVILQNETHLAKAAIRPDGTFQIGSYKKNDGLPPGIYRVGITGAIETHESNSSAVLVEDIGFHTQTPGPRSLIGAMYSNPDTSGIVFDTSKDKELNIILER